MSVQGFPSFFMRRITASCSAVYLLFFFGRGCGSDFITFGLDGVAVASGGSGIESGSVGAIGGIIDGDIKPFMFEGTILSNAMEGPCLGGITEWGSMFVAVGMEDSMISSSIDRLDPVRRRRLPLERVMPPCTGTVEATDEVYRKGV